MSRISNQSDVFKDMLEFPPGADGAEGTSDANPVILPQITADEFRNLLYLFYGSPLSPDFISFVSSASDTQSQWPTTFKRYLDVAKLARRFCMTETEEWAQKQLREIISSLSPPVDWLTPTDILSALSYFKLCDANSGDDLVRKARSLAYFALHHSPRESTVALYKNPPADMDRALYGFLFVRMLSAGHRSSTWAELTWVERATFYAAQVHMTPLPQSSPFCYLGSAENAVGALEDADESSPVCPNTMDVLKAVWEGVSVPWGSPLPLEGLSGIRNLLWARRKLENRLLSTPCTCGEQACHDPLLVKLDTLIEILFIEIANLRDQLSDQ
ncbi:hypothetical protein FRC10_003826 [Ceratobasidium sp. 414]|nr:hypothetical protein FRC10_003826 [Ceratobasidium sp. 414]